jgi:large subunit ribosomal protein L13
LNLGEDGVEKTYVIKGKPQSDWVVIDANEQSLGRMATEVARYLLGKHKPTFTPGVDMGDFVVVINASKLNISQKKLEDKFYHRHSNYPGGLSTASLGDLMKTNPQRVIREAVKGMLPHNRLGKKLIQRLKIYSGNIHPHEAQQPQPVTR